MSTRRTKRPATKVTIERILLRPHEAAEAMGVSRSKVYTLMARRELPSVRVGHSMRVPIEALRAWVAKHQVA